MTWRRRPDPLDSPFSLRRPREVEVEDVSSALAAAEYASVRDESLQSFATSQSIIQWSLATYGVLFGAGLLALGDVDAAFVKLIAWMAAVIYGLLLPGLICAASWSWLGEIRRMERAGAYLRGLERRVRSPTARSLSSVAVPLNWESFLAGATHPGSPAVKGWAPYIGTALLFGGAGMSSVVFFYFWVDRILQQGPATLGLWTIVGTSAGLVILFLVVSVHVGLGVVELGSHHFDFETGRLESSRKPMRRFVRPLIYVLLALVIISASLVLLPD